MFGIIYAAIGALIGILLLVTRLLFGRAKRHIGNFIGMGEVDRKNLTAELFGCKVSHHNATNGFGSKKMIVAYWYRPGANRSIITEQDIKDSLAWLTSLLDKMPGWFLRIYYDESILTKVSAADYAAGGGVVPPTEEHLWWAETIGVAQRDARIQTTLVRDAVANYTVFDRDRPEIIQLKAAAYGAAMHQILDATQPVDKIINIVNKFLNDSNLAVAALAPAAGPAAQGAAIAAVKTQTDIDLKAVYDNFVNDIGIVKAAVDGLGGLSNAALRPAEADAKQAITDIDALAKAIRAAADIDGIEPNRFTYLKNMATYTKSLEDAIKTLDDALYAYPAFNNDLRDMVCLFPYFDNEIEFTYCPQYNVDGDLAKVDVSDDTLAAINHAYGDPNINVLTDELEAGNTHFIKDEDYAKITTPTDILGSSTWALRNPKVDVHGDLVEYKIGNPLDPKVLIPLCVYRKIYDTTIAANVDICPYPLRELMSLPVARNDTVNKVSADFGAIAKRTLINGYNSNAAGERALIIALAGAGPWATVAQYCIAALKNAIRLYITADAALDPYFVDVINNTITTQLADPIRKNLVTSLNTELSNIPFDGGRVYFQEHLTKHYAQLVANHAPYAQDVSYYFNLIANCMGKINTFGNYVAKLYQEKLKRDYPPGSEQKYAPPKIEYGVVNPLDLAFADKIKTNIYSGTITQDPISFLKNVRRNDATEFTRVARIVLGRIGASTDGDDEKLSATLNAALDARGIPFYPEHRYNPLLRAALCKDITDHITMAELKPGA